MFYLTRVKCFGFITVLVCLVFLCGSESASAQTELIVNGSFETGNFNGWTITQPAVPFRPWRVTGAGQGGGFPSVHTTQPQSGVFSAWNGFDAGAPVPAQFTLSQTVNIPAMSSTRLTWIDRVSWNMRDFGGSTQPRLYQVQIRNTSGAVLQTIYTFTAPPRTAGDTGYVRRTANLSAFAGQTIQIFFLENIPEPNTGPGQFEIDSVSLIAAPQVAAPFDFDGDRRADYAVFRPSSTTFFIRRSSNSSFFSVPFGLADDRQAPGDYDGDNRADISVFRPSNGFFYVLRSSDNTVQSVQFGQRGDEPVARDYNGDGRTDFAVVRRAGGRLTWFILTSNNFTFSATQFGLDTDVVAPGDYDGDGRFDLAVYRGSGADRTGPATFFVQGSTSGFRAVQFGLGSDLVVPGDYDGDGRTDFAVVRTGMPYTWYILNSSNFSFRAVQFGTKPFLTTQADYDGDGRTDISVFNPQTGTFFTLQSSNNAVVQVQFGQNGDYPIANSNTF